MYRLVAILVLASVIAISKSEDTKDACEAQANCVNEALAKRRECYNITQTIESRWPTKYNEHTKSIADKVANVTEIDFRKRAHKYACLTDSLANTTIVTCDVVKKAKCAELVAASKPRAKRDTPIEEPEVPVFVEVLEETQPLFDEEGHIVAKRQAAATTAKPTTAKPPTTPSSAKEKEALQKLYNTCKAEADALDSKCTALSACCSENWLCDLKFQQTPDYNQYARVQHALQIERRTVSCPAPAPTTPAPTPAASG